MLTIDITANETFSAAYKGSGGYLVALDASGAPVAIERLLSPKMRRRWVEVRRYRGRPTAASQAALCAARVAAMADFDAQVAAFEATHGDARYGFGSCTVVHVAGDDRQSAMSVENGEEVSFWRLHDRRRAARAAA